MTVKVGGISYLCSGWSTSRPKLAIFFQYSWISPIFGYFGVKFRHRHWQKTHRHLTLEFRPFGEISPNLGTLIKIFKVHNEEFLTYYFDLRWENYIEKYSSKYLESCIPTYIKFHIWIKTNYVILIYKLDSMKSKYVISYWKSKEVNIL